MIHETELGPGQYRDMTESSMPSTQTLAPLVDQLQDIAQEEIPEPQTCRIRLYDDNTYRIAIEHRRRDGVEAIVYDRVTGEVYWRDSAGARKLRIIDPVYYDLITSTYFEEGSEEVVAEIEPPIQCEPTTVNCKESEEVDRCSLWADS